MPESMVTMMNNDEINSLVKNVIEQIISSNEPYKHSAVAEWNDQICEQIVQRLIQNQQQKHQQQQQNVPSQQPQPLSTNDLNKFIVSTTIVQKNGAGISNTSRCYWNQMTDHYFNIRWENKYLYCIVNLYIVGL